MLSLIFAPDGDHLVSAGSDRTVRVWNVQTGNQVGELVGHSAVVLSLTFSPDGRTLASASGDQTIRLWDWPGLKTRVILRGHTDEVWGLAFSADGKSLVSSGKDESIRTWDLSRPEERRFAWAVPKDTPNVMLCADARRLGVLYRWCVQSPGYDKLARAVDSPVETAALDERPGNDGSQSTMAGPLDTIWNDPGMASAKP